MTDSELRAIIERLRRSTRSVDVLDVCDELEARMVTPVVTQVTRMVTPKRDRAAYMRDYRARRPANAHP